VAYMGRINAWRYLIDRIKREVASYLAVLIIRSRVVRPKLI